MLQTNLDPIWVACKAFSNSVVPKEVNTTPLKISMVANWGKEINLPTMP